MLLSSTQFYLRMGNEMEYLQLRLTFCIEMNGFKWSHERISHPQAMSQNFIYVFYTDYTILFELCIKNVVSLYQNMDLLI